MAVFALSAARGQDAGSERPGVPLPAPKAADALHGEVSSSESRQQAWAQVHAQPLTGLLVSIPLSFTPSLSCPHRHKEEPKLPDSASSDEENEDGDFTVYECPGLAPVGRAPGSCVWGERDPTRGWDVHMSFIQAICFLHVS